ncbi:MAG: hypothetical protein Fues2KO_25550 [Fuerstiella sp.]
MGIVYRAVCENTGKVFALKMLNPGLLSDQDARKRLSREAELLGHVDNPHIPRLVEVLEHEGSLAIVSEFVEGQTLTELLQQYGRLPELMAADIAEQLASALSHAAEKSIIHRDLKPSNVLLRKVTDSGDGYHAFLTDFGLARRTQQTESQQLTRRSTMLGTPVYMSPEQFTDEVRVDGRSDIYSLGLTLFQMLTGRAPYSADHVIDLADLHRFSAVPDPRDEVAELSDAVSFVTRQCLQKEPGLRYRSAEELRCELRRIRLGQPIGIAVHPVQPAFARNQLQTFRFRWKLHSPPDQLWPHVSNTERLNRAIGLPAVNYFVARRPDAGPVMRAEIRIAGMKMNWVEHAFEWIEGQRLGVLREFEAGPLKWFTSSVSLLPLPSGGTELVHELQVLPGSAFGRLFARYKMGVETRRALQRVYQRIDSILASSPRGATRPDLFEAAPQLRNAQDAALQQVEQRLLQAVPDRESVIEVLDYLRTAAAQDVARLRPKALSDRLGLPFDSVVAILLHGTTLGLFELYWDVICPTCRVSTQSYSRASLVQKHDRCEVCDADFQVDLLNRVEVVFRSNDRYREVDTGRYCIGSPVHTRHIAAQLRLPPNQTTRFALRLAEGQYHLRSPHLAGSLRFKVTANDTRQSEEDIVQVNLNDRTTWEDRQMSLHCELQSFHVSNDFEKEVVVRIERSATDDLATTAAEFMTSDLFLSLFPAQRFDAAQWSTDNRTTLLLAAGPRLADLNERFGRQQASVIAGRFLQRLYDLTSAHGGTWVKADGVGGLVSFLISENASACADELVRGIDVRSDGAPIPVKCAVATGPVSCHSIAGRRELIGPAIDALTQSLQSVDFGTVTVLPERND